MVRLQPAIIFYSKTNKAIKGAALGYCTCELLLPWPHLSVLCYKPISNLKRKKKSTELETFICNAIFSPLLLVISGIECRTF